MIQARPVLLAPTARRAILVIRDRLVRKAFRVSPAPKVLKGHRDQSV